MERISKHTIGWAALILWVFATAGIISFIKSFALGASLGPMEPKWLVIPLLVAIVSFGLLILAYKSLIKDKKFSIKALFIIVLILPYTVFYLFSVYIVSSIAVVPYFTEEINLRVKVRLGKDKFNKPVFFFHERGIQSNSLHDPYRKHIHEYPPELLELSNQKAIVDAQMVIQYTYNKAVSFSITEIDGMFVKANQIHASFLPDEFVTWIQL